MWLSDALGKGKTISLGRSGVQANQACTLEKLGSAMLAPYSSLFPEPLPSVLGIPQKPQRESVTGKDWGRPWKVGLPRMPRQATLSSAPWESRLVSSESWFSPNRCKQRSPRRSEINAALTLFCICKRTWIKKDSKCACIRSALSCQTRGPRYGCEMDTEQQGLWTGTSLNSVLQEEPTRKENTVMRNRAENGIKAFIRRMPGERRGGRVEHCRQRLPRLDRVQGLIMADIPAHNHKFLSIMWGKSLHCQSRCPVQK